MKKKGLLALVGSICLVLVLAALPFMTACPKTTPTAPATTPATTPAQEKPIELRFADFFPPTAGTAILCTEFCAELEERTEGALKITYLPGGSLLKAPAMYSGVAEGIADIGLAHCEYTLRRFPVTECLDLPHGYPSAWVSTHVVNDFYENFTPNEWNDVHVLLFHATGPNVIISQEPIYTLEDFKGKAIRGPGRIGDTVKALGGTPRPMPTPECYEAFSKGVLDGGMLPYEPFLTFRFAEVNNYVTTCWEIGNIYTFYIVMNKDSWNSLPEDIQEVLDEVSEDYVEKFAVCWNDLDVRGREFCREQGVEFIDLPSEEMNRWGKVTETVRENYVEEMVAHGYSEEEIRGWFEFISERSDYWLEQQIEAEIKSPTGPKEIKL